MEALAIPIVNQLLGEYISNLETNQLEIGLWSGNVKLKDLRLKSEMFSQWDIPVNVVYGTIDRLNITIPWNDIKQKPTRIEIENVFILCNPIIQVGQVYDPYKEQLVLQEEKQKRLRSMEAELTRQLHQTDNSGYLAQIGSAVIDNLQIEIKNIHIRYEDNSSCPGTPFGVGVTLSGLSAVSTDKDWLQKTVAVNTGIVYKLLKLGHLGIYCSTGSESFANRPDVHDVFLKSIEKQKQVDAAKQYFMDPVSGTGKLIWMRRNLNTTQPIYDLNVDFDDLAFNLDDKQYQTFMSVFGTLTRQKLQYPYRRFRPPAAVTVKLDPLEWFKYAGKCVLQDVHQKRVTWTWAHFSKRRDMRKRYIELYTLYRKKKLSEVESAEFDQLEWDLSFDDIRFYRHLTVIKMKKEKSISPTRAKGNEVPTVQQSPTWYGWLTGVAPKDEKQLLEEKLNELYESFKYEEVQVKDQTFPPNYVKMQVKNHLSSGSITLRKFHTQSKISDFAYMKFSNMVLDYLQYPARYKFDVGIQDFKVSESVVAKVDYYPHIIEGQVDADRDQLLIGTFETKSKSGNDSLVVKMLPLRVFVNPHFFKTIFEFFKVNEEHIESISRIQMAAQDAFQGVSQQTRAGLVFAIEEHKTVDVDLEIDAPIFVFLADVSQKNTEVIVLDAGHLKFKSNLVQIKDSSEELLNKSIDQLIQIAYDTYLVNLSNLKVFTGKIEADVARQNIISYDDILEDLDFSIKLQASILQKSLQLSRFRVFIDLPKVLVKFSEHKAVLMKRILKLMSETFKSGETPAVSEDLKVLRRVSELDIDLNQLSLKTVEELEAESKTLAAQTQLELYCNLGQISVVLKSETSPIASFEIHKVSLEGKVKRLSSTLTASLQSLLVKDTTRDAKEEFALLISPNIDPQDKSPLVALEFSSINDSEKGDFFAASIKLQPIKFIFVRECVLRIYHFAQILMASDEPATATVTSPNGTKREVKKKSSWNLEIEINSVLITLAEEAGILGLMKLEGFRIALISELPRMKATGAVGRISWQDVSGPKSRPVLHIEDANSLDFAFERFEPGNEPISGFDSKLDIHTASWRFTYDTIYMKRVNAYMEKLRDIAFILENAQKAAQESSTKLQEAAGRLNFTLNIKTPIIEVLNGDGPTPDRLLFYPGEITAKSNVENSTYGESSLVQDRYGIEVRSMKIQSLFASETEQVCMDIVEDVHLNIQYDSMVQIQGFPDSFVYVSGSNVNVKMTDHQYRLAVEIFKMINQSNENQATSPDGNTPPEKKSYSEYVIKLDSILLEAYSCPSKFVAREKYSLARLVGYVASAKLKLQPATPILFELRFNSLSVIDTRSTKESKFRDIMIPLKESEDQFVLRYENSPLKSEYQVTIDRPKLILEVDHILAIQRFAVSAWNTDTPPDPNQILIGRVSFVNGEIVIVKDPAISNTDAVVLVTKYLVITQDSIITASFKGLGMFFCMMDDRQGTELRFLDDCDVEFTRDGNIGQDGIRKFHTSLDTSKLLFRVSNQDVLLLKSLTDRLVASSTVETPQTEEIESQKFRLSMEGIQAVLIDDMGDIHMPIFELSLERTVYEISDWSRNYQFDAGVSLSANYFNLKNSHWEPLVESWHFSGRKESEDKQSLVFLCRKKLELNITQPLLESVFGLMKDMNNPRQPSVSRTSVNPYVIVNLSGYDLILWNDLKSNEFDFVDLADGQQTDWRFDDWRKLRERTKVQSNLLGLQFKGPSWEKLKGISVDREGSKSYVLRPAINGVLHRVIVEVKLKEKLKYVTIRSTRSIVNCTNLELQIGFVPKGSKKPELTIRIKPNETYNIPIESGYSDTIFVRPADFAYHWSRQGLFWKDILGKKMHNVFLLNCNPIEEGHVFNFQVNLNVLNQDREYPELVFKFMSPLILENRLPYMFKYVLKDRSTNQQIPGTLKGGESSYLHTVDSRRIITLSIALESKGLEQHEGVIITTSDLEYRDEHLTLRDPTGKELILRINYSDLTSTGRVVSIYCPYLIFNRTNLDLFFSSKSLMTMNRLTAGQEKQDHTLSEIEPILFSYASHEPGKSRAFVRTLASDWSKAISFDAVGTSYMTSLPLKSGLQALLGVEIQEGDGRYSLSKIVSIKPRFMLRNNMNIAISYGIGGSIKPTILNAGEISSLSSVKPDPEDGECQLSIKFENLLSKWSNPFTINHIGSIFVKLGKIGSSEYEDLVKVDIQLEKATIFITFSDGKDRWPYRIENHCNIDVCYSQLDASDQYLIRPGETQHYAWDFPSWPKKAVLLEVNGIRRAVELSHIGGLEPLKYPLIKGSASMDIEVVADGIVTVLVLNPVNSPKAESREGSLMGSSTADRPRDSVSTSDYLSLFQAHIEGVGISLISKDNKEILYASAKSLMIMQTETETDRLTNISLKWLQVDNQLASTASPIFIYPTVITQEKRENDQEDMVLFASACQSKDKSMGVEYFRWLTVLLQELSLDIEEEFLTVLIDFFKFDGENGTERQLSNSRQIQFPTDPNNTDRLYFEKLWLQPVQINLTYSRSDRNTEKDLRVHSSGPLTLVYDVLTATVGNVHNAPIRLNALEILNLLSSRSSLQDIILNYYSDEVYRQIHKLVGSADFLGNPVGLFNNISSGVKDMFYEPIQGFQITKPEEFGIGVAKGASSLMRKTVFGLSDTMSKFTGSVGKGLSVLTMDAKFQDSRRIAKKNRPKHVGHGVAKGAMSLARGITSGVTGIVSQPLEGAQSGGFEGFFKGVGRGLLGVVTKPVVGVVDLAANISEGIKNTATGLDSELERQRLPRFISKEGILKPYSLKEALGQNWLKELENGKYASEAYLRHMELRREDLAVILTENRVLMVRISNIKLEYDGDFADIRKISSNGTQIYLGLKQARDSQWVIPCPDENSASWLRKQIENAFFEYIQNFRPFE